MKNKSGRGVPGVLRIFLLALVPVLKAVIRAVFNSLGTIPALIIMMVILLLLGWRDMRRKQRQGTGTNGDASAADDLSASTRAPQPGVGNKTDSAPGEVPGWIRFLSVSLSVALMFLMVILLQAGLDYPSILLLLPLAGVLLHGEAVYRIYFTHEDEEMLWGTAEDARVERRRSQLSMIRGCAVWEALLFSLFLAKSVSALFPDPLRQDVTGFIVLPVFGAGIWAAVRFARWPDPMTFHGRELLSVRRYTVKSLWDELKDRDTMFGTPGIARIRFHGRAVLYGPTTNGVYVFLIPSPLRKRIAVRLMAAPSAVSKYEELPAYTVEIDERLNGYGPGMDYEAVLNEMTVEINRLLSGAEEGE